MTVTNAIDFARNGEVADASTALLAGLRQAEGLLANGEPWAEELAWRYWVTMERAAERWRAQ